MNAPSAGGLSPQARGNPGFRVFALRVEGPIPAGAGEPTMRSWICGRPRAYPRRRGGTLTKAQIENLQAGLSPQARGNPLAQRRRHRHQGPIPAGAGEPSPRLTLATSETAYPRRRGGTRICIRATCSSAGLSPQARGNPYLHPCNLQQCGPIPAGAGEPASHFNDLRRAGAYPRRRGGTRSSCERRSAASGLSPQARGNLEQMEAGCDASGPIPAGAGEPAYRHTNFAIIGAYPRRRGGTVGCATDGLAHQGLSPQARGNPPRLGH